MSLLKGLREILLKKADGNPYLEILIESIGEERLADRVLQSLEKMAAHKGANANHGIVTLGGDMMAGHTVDMLRDAIGHHVTNYGAALKRFHAASDPTEKAKFRKMADDHANKIIPYMDLALKVAPHSGGKLLAGGGQHGEFPKLEPWIMNATKTDKARTGSGKPLNDPEGFKNRPRPNGRTANSLTNWRVLEGPAHPRAHIDFDKGKNLTDEQRANPYPFHEVQLGDPEAVANKQAFLPIKKLSDEELSGLDGNFVPHPFDSHPVNELNREGKISDDELKSFNEKYLDWQDSDDNKSFEDKYLSGQTGTGTEAPHNIWEGLPHHLYPHHSDHPNHSDHEAYSGVPDVEEQRKLRNNTSYIKPKAEQAGQVRASVKAPTSGLDLSKPPAGVADSVAKYWDRLPEERKRAIHGEMSGEESEPSAPSDPDKYSGDVARAFAAQQAKPEVDTQNMPIPGKPTEAVKAPQQDDKQLYSEPPKGAPSAVVKHWPNMSTNERKEVAAKIVKDQATKKGPVTSKKPDIDNKANKDILEQWNNFSPQEKKAYLRSLAGKKD